MHTIETTYACKEGSRDNDKPVHDREERGGGAG